MLHINVPRAVRRDGCDVRLAGKTNVYGTSNQNDSAVRWYSVHEAEHYLSAREVSVASEEPYWDVQLEQMHGDVGRRCEGTHEIGTHAFRPV